MSASHVRKSLLSLNSWNYGGGSPAIPIPHTSCSKERSNSNASCRTTASSSALALATSNMVDFWNRVSQQMAYIDGSTRSPSLIGDGGSCGTRSSLPNDLSGNGAKDVLLTAAPGNNQSLSLLDDDRILGSTVASINSRSVSLLDGAADSIPEEEDDVQDEEDPSPPLLPLPPTSEALPAQKVLPQKVTSPASLSGSGRYTATTCSPETAALTYVSPPQRKHSKHLQRQANVTSSEDVSGDDVPEVVEEKEQKGNGWRGASVRPWNRRTASLSSARNFRQHTMKSDEDDTQSAIWHHVFSEVPQDRMNNNSSNRKGTFYRNLFNDEDDDECFFDDGGGVGIMELELLQPAAINLCNAGRIYKCGSRIGGVMPNSASVVLETASMGGSRMTTKTRLHRYQQQFGFHGAGGRRLSQPFDMVFYYHAGVGTKKASSWEESEAVQRRRSVMLAAAVVGTGTGPGYPITTSCPGTTGLLMLHPTSSELQLLDKRDLRYYFQHPYPRLFVTYFVIFCNFLLFAEDPISHSHTESDIPMVGNVFSFVLTKYPPEWRWSLIKVLMWLLAMLIGMILGKLLIHGYVCGKLLRLKMFRDDQGSWMTMFLTVIVSLYVFSHAYNLLLVLWYDDSHYQINSQMGVTNASVMKAAACGTWLGDLITALMVTDMMLQDNLYPHWASWFRQLWRRSNVPRILIFWVGSVVATSVVVTLIVSDWISWDRLNRDFVATTELSRAFLASFILVMDLLIVMQDWDFPHFTTTLHVNLPGFSVATLNWKYAEVDITGKWFNYGIIVMVMLLDLNMWKNQIFYNPKDFGQYTDIDLVMNFILPTEKDPEKDLISKYITPEVTPIGMTGRLAVALCQEEPLPSLRNVSPECVRGPDDKIRTVNDPEVLTTGNISYWTWESRSRINPDTNLPYYEEDMQMNSRFMCYPLSVKWTAFIPSVIGLVLFVSLVSLYGRFPAHQPHGVKRNQSPCRGVQGKQEGNSR